MRSYSIPYARRQQTYYLSLEEIEPHREIQLERCVPKILCDVARPIYSTNGELSFDGEKDIFPFISHVRAQRSSKNRKKEIQK